MSSLENANVVIIGATSGIGLAAAQQAASAGANVWGVSRSQDKVDSAARAVPKANFSAVDIHDVDALARLFESVGTVHHVAGCATGADRTKAPFLEQTDEQFKEAFGKFWGYCNIVREVAPWLTDDGSITLVSGTPARKCNVGMSAISCVGNAVEGLTRALALELAPRRVNVVAPGIIDTGMFDRFGEKKEEILTGMGKNVPLGRVGQANEVASAIIAAMTNTYMTGATLDVDGGSLLP
ncbi:MAG: SDR family oxidoreductase [Gammaproteobacteria bacterium]|nr:SDR family oxidoreductase [Gammaproteobacteria bacterium]